MSFVIVNVQLNLQIWGQTFSSSDWSKSHFRPAHVTTVRSSHRRCPIKKLLLKKCNIHMKTPVLGSLFIKVASLKVCNFIKKRLQRRYFPVNIAKFLRTPISKNIWKRFLNSYSKGEYTLWNISFRLFHETQFNSYFITYNWISWNSRKICKKKSITNYHK